MTTVLDKQDVFLLIGTTVLLNISSIYDNPFTSIASIIASPFGKYMLNIAYRLTDSVSRSGLKIDIRNYLVLSVITFVISVISGSIACFKRVEYSNLLTYQYKTSTNNKYFFSSFITSLATGFIALFGRDNNAKAKPFFITVGALTLLPLMASGMFLGNALKAPTMLKVHPLRKLLYYDRNLGPCQSTGKIIHDMKTKKHRVSGEDNNDKLEIEHRIIILEEETDDKKNALKSQLSKTYDHDEIKDILTDLNKLTDESERELAFLKGRMKKRQSVEYFGNKLDDKKREIENRVSDKQVSGKQVSGKQVSGKQVSGKQVSGKQVSGKQVSGKQVSGKQVSGKQVSGKKTRPIKRKPKPVKRKPKPIKRKPVITRRKPVPDEEGSDREKMTTINMTLNFRGDDDIYASGGSVIEGRCTSCNSKNCDGNICKKEGHPVTVGIGDRKTITLPPVNVNNLKGKSLSGKKKTRSDKKRRPLPRPHPRPRPRPRPRVTTDVEKRRLLKPRLIDQKRKEEYVNINLCRIRLRQSLRCFLIWMLMTFIVTLISYVSGTSLKYIKS